MDSKVQPKLMFFNDEWSVGKVLDAVADAGSIDNLNNKMGEEVRACFLPLVVMTSPFLFLFLQQKLYLFSVKTGEPILHSLKLKDVDGNQLYSGGCVLLEKMTSIAQDK